MKIDKTLENLDKQVKKEEIKQEEVQEQQVVQQDQVLLTDLTTLTSATLRTPIELANGDNLIVSNINLTGWNGREEHLHKAISIINNALKAVNNNISLFKDPSMLDKYLEYISSFTKELLENNSFIDRNGEHSDELPVQIHDMTLSDDDLLEYMFVNKIKENVVGVFNYIEDLSENKIDDKFNREICK